MTHTEIIAHNESLAIQKIQSAYDRDGFVAAMGLCVEYMGLNTRDAYERTKLIVGDGDDR